MELWGNLKDFSLPDVIQLVGFGRKSGVLSVAHSGGHSQLYFSSGNVIHAVSNDIEGEDAVYALFRVEEGEFRFQADASPPTQTIFMDPTNLVMEAARLLDESSRENGSDLPGSGSFDNSSAFQTPEPKAKPKPERPKNLTPDELRNSITEYLEKKFGKESKRLTQAVAKCGDSIADFQELVVRVERFVSAFVDPKAASQVGNEIKEMIRRLPGAF